MNFNQLEWFCKAVETRSFAKAAEESFVSRQAFSKAIGKLERELGVDLFVRGKSGVQPTTLSQELYPIAKRCIRNGQDIKTMCDDYVLGSRQTVRMALADGVVESLPQGFFALMEEKNPGADIKFEKHYYARCKDLLDSGEVSFAVSPGPERIEGYDSILLVQERLYAAGRKGCVPFSGKPCSPTDFEGVEYFTVGRGRVGSLGLEELLESAGVRAVRNSRYTEYGLILEKARSGRGVALVPEDSLERVSGQDMAVAPFPMDMLSWKVFLYFRTNSLTRVERRMLEFMKAHAPAQACA